MRHDPTSQLLMFEKLSRLVTTESDLADQYGAAFHRAVGDDPVGTDATVGAALRARVDRLLDSGWTPSELARVVEAETGGVGLSALADVCASWAKSASPGPRVRSELRELGGSCWWGDQPWLAARIGLGGAQGWRDVCGLWRAVEGLPRLPAAALDDDDGGLDADVLRKVRALLAKAESTSFVEEAESLSAKAHELITRHALDGAAVASGRPADDLRTRVVFVDRPYVKAKSLLLTVVARANRARVVRLGHADISIVVGHPSDLDAIDVLYTSLLTQATRAMLAEGGAIDRRGTNRTKSFRRSFLIGFASAVGDRLRASTRLAEESLDDATRSSALPVLAAKDDAAERAIEDAFPRLRTERSTASNGAGLGAGRAAGERADLGSSRVRGNRGELAS